MFGNRRKDEILTAHPAVERVTLREAGETSTIQTNGSVNLAPLLEQLGLVVMKTKRHQKSDVANRKKLWPYWYQVLAAPPGSQVLDHDTIVALVCAKVLTLKQNDLPASIMNATTATVDVFSIWGIRYTLHRIGKGLYLMRSFVASLDVHVYRGMDDSRHDSVKLDILGPTVPPGPEIACVQAGPGRENTDEA